MASFQFVQLLGAVVLVYHITRILYRLYWHPLAKFPGPRLAAATSAYEIYYDVLKRGQFIWELERLHKQYGPIVRINPHELHIKDPDYYDTIYSGAGQKRDKYDRWTMMAGAPGSAFSAAPHDLHRVRRAALNSFFAKRSVVRLEPRIADKVDTLCTRLADASRTGSVLELNVVFMALTMDVITEYCYGKSYNYLLEPDFKREWKETLEKLFEDAAFRRTVPWMTYMMQRIPQSYILKLVPNLESLITWEKEIYAEVKAIVSRGKGSSTDQEPESIFKELRDTELLPQSEKSVQRLADEGQVLIGAGAETTAKTLAYTAFYVLDTPGVLATLRNELNSLHKDPNSLTWTELEGLPYLTGVVKEGLRLSYGITTRLPRVPHESLQYREWLIPPRTPISETTYFISVDPDIFPDPHEFKPERWMWNDGPRLDRYLTSFSKGTRGCLGINLAYAELYLTLAAVFGKFDFELFETTIDDVRVARDAFVPAPKIGSRGVRVVVKGEV